MHYRIAGIGFVVASIASNVSIRHANNGPNPGNPVGLSS